MAEALYSYMLDEARKSVPVFDHGEFGADMKVSLLNDGPFTVILDENILYQRGIEDFMNAIDLYDKPECFK